MKYQKIWKDFYNECFKTLKKEMKEDVKNGNIPMPLKGRILKIALLSSHNLMQFLSKL